MNKPDQNPRREGARAGNAFDVVVDGYDAVYAAAASSPAFAGLWADHAYGGPFPAEFAHISFLTYDELQVMAHYLALGQGAVLADLACGAGGPGLWIATQCGASVLGVDPSSAGLAQARTRAEQVGLTDRSLYQQGTFASTGLGHGAADAALSVDAIQYAPDKTEVFREAYRILRPRGRLAFSAFEVDPERVAGIPVLGVDPVPDYAPLLATAGFVIDWYQESAGWADRVSAAFGAVMEAMPALTDEMGEAAAASLQMECAVTLQLRALPAPGHRPRTTPRTLTSLGVATRGRAGRHGGSHGRSRMQARRRRLGRHDLAHTWLRAAHRRGPRGQRTLRHQRPGVSAELRLFAGCARLFGDG